MKVLTDATLRVRDCLYEGLLIRQGEVLTEALCRERAANLCMAVVETIREGLIAAKSQQLGAVPTSEEPDHTEDLIK